MHPPTSPDYLGPLATQERLAQWQTGTAELPSLGVERSPVAPAEPPNPEPPLGTEGSFRSLAIPDRLAQWQTGTAELPSLTVEPSQLAPLKPPEPEHDLGGEGSLKRLPIDRCAALAASLARRPDETARILEAGALSLPVWKANEAYWAEVLREETAQGRTKLLHAYDAAFVTRLELERGAISVEDWARLVVAAERGQTSTVLQALDLPQGSVVRIERVLLRRAVENPALGDEVRSAVARLRGG